VALFGQNYGAYAVTSTYVLATNQDFQYTEGHFAKGLRFVEFLLNTNITEEEKRMGLQEALQSFQQSPAATLQEIESFDGQMQRVYQLQDPTQIALFRSAMLSQLAAAFQQSNESFILKDLINKYNPILAYDLQNMLAFTYKDFEAYLSMLSFQAQLYGQSFYLDAATKYQYQQQMVQTFLQGSLEIRQSLALMEICNEYLQVAYARMNAEQQAQMQLSFLQETPTNDSVKDYSKPENVTWPPGVNTKEEKQAYLAKRRQEISTNNFTYQTMSNMLLENHVGMMNIIEDFGGGNSYWEVKYDNY
jgi:hypothetical protein